MTPPPTYDMSTPHLRWLVSEARGEASACRANEQDEAGDLYDALADYVERLMAERDALASREAGVRAFFAEIKQERKKLINDYDYGYDTTAYMDAADCVIARLTQALDAPAPASDTRTGTETTDEQP